MGRPILISFVPLCALSTIYQPVQPPSPCEGCVSHDFPCAEPCARGGRNWPFWEFDGTYKHPDKTCHEFIPYNSSSLQIDLSLYCRYPETQVCRTETCDVPTIGCDNMYGFYFGSGLSGLGGCHGTELAQKLYSEQCYWVCKHRMPYIRCIVHFDPSNYYGLQNQIDACWVERICKGGAPSSVSVTCKPQELQLQELIDLSGALTLSMKDAALFVGAPSIHLILAQGIASSLTDVAANMVRIHRIVSPSNSRAPLRRRLEQSLRVDYTITTVVKHVHRLISEMKATGIHVWASKINEALDSEGFTMDISVLATSGPSARMKVSAELQASEQELRALDLLKDVVAQHLNEALAELEETQQSLQAEQLHPTLTPEQLEALNGEYNRVRSRLSSLTTSHHVLRARLEAASALHNQTHEFLAEAQAAESIASSKLEEALANLSSVQSELSLAESRRSATSSRLDEALASHNLTLSSLAALRANHSVLVKELQANHSSEVEALKSNHSSVVEELKSNQSSVLEELRSLEADHENALQIAANLEVFHREANLSANQASQERDEARAQLEQAQAANRETAAELQSALVRERALDANLSNVTSSLNNVRQDLWSLQNENDNISKTLEETLKELSETQEKLRWEKEIHKNISQILDTERDAHEKTKQELHREQDEQDSLVIAGGALAGVAMMLLLSLCGMYRHRKKLAVYCLSSNPHVDEATNSSVVVGCPVHDMRTVHNNSCASKAISATDAQGMSTATDAENEFEQALRISAADTHGVPTAKDADDELEQALRMSIEDSCNHPSNSKAAENDCIPVVDGTAAIAPSTGAPAEAEENRRITCSGEFSQL